MINQTDKLVAGYANYPGYGNTPRGGIKGFEDIFWRGLDMSYEKDLSCVDAIILWGGADISPELYHQQHYMSRNRYEPSDRDVFEWELLRLAAAAKKPIIGVCRGAQMLCAFAGGKLIQHLDGHNSGAHEVITTDGKVFNVSSLHHQALYPYNLRKNEYKVLATVAKNRSFRYEGLSKDEAAVFDSVLEPEVVFFPRLLGMSIQCHPELHQGFNPFNEWIVAQVKSLCFHVKEATPSPV